MCCLFGGRLAAVWEGGRSFTPTTSHPHSTTHSRSYKQPSQKPQTLNQPLNPTPPQTPPPPPPNPAPHQQVNAFIADKRSMKIGMDFGMSLGKNYDKMRSAGAGDAIRADSDKLARSFTVSKCGRPCARARALALDFGGVLGGGLGG